MSDLVVRRLMVDMAKPIAPDWSDGNVFRSAFLNALSMSFPQGEQFFIDSVRKGEALLKAAGDDSHAAAIKGFIGQEATHRHLHGQYNQHLTDLGYVNHWEHRIVYRRRWVEDKHTLHWLAATAAYEHFTAIFAQWLLHNPQVLGNRDERLKTLWMWHAAEESEHRSVAFDLYRALGGNEKWRKRWFRQVTWIFITDALRQTFSHLRHDGQLWRRRTWSEGWAFLLGRQGLLRGVYQDWRAYFRADFHPDEHDDSASRDWLAAHSAEFKVVGKAASTAQATA